MNEAPHDQAWYAAMARLTGYTAKEHWAAQYPGQSGQNGTRNAEIVARCRALGIDQEKIVAEMTKPLFTLFAAGWRTQGGVMHYFDCPNPSLQALRSTIPPDTMPPNAHAYLVKLEGEGVSPVARWDGEGWVRKKEKQ